MGEKKKFTAVIRQGIGGGAYVDVPFDVEKAFGAKRVKVKALIDGRPYRGSLVRMGGPGHILGVLKEIRSAVGKEVGDRVEVEVEEDREPRTIEAPRDLEKALRQNVPAGAKFAELSYTHKREYVRWIEEAKRVETRQERIRKVLAMLAREKEKK